MCVSKWIRIIPVAFVMYMLAYMDRINVGILLPAMQKDLHLSASAAGEIAGIFFWGYMILQIPGGILATRWSARKLIFILMLLWGIASVACGLVQTEAQLKWVRFLLGVAEGGVWPAVLVLLASWFTNRERARANAVWMSCLPVSAMLMAPLSGMLLTYFDWRAVFIIEGLPPLIWAFVWLAVIQDRPTEAKWMKEDEKKQLLETLRREQLPTEAVGYRGALLSPLVWGLVLMYFFWITGFYGYTMWVPSVVGTFAKDPAAMGWLTAIPFACALVAMVVNSQWSDRRMNRIQHVAIPLLIASIAMVVGQWVESPLWQMVLLSITAMGVYAPYGPLWAIPTATFPASVAGAAMGLQNAVGNLGGYFGPKFVGMLKDTTGHYHAGFYLLAVSLMLAALITWIMARSSAPGHRTKETAM
ncbi:MFS transporter [Marinithermofilum abyssi]|uniref:MFS transporter n=1 Tax=Marinithermofilum abyssi TaxID=1571185 RepID=A0A8J2YDT7_9BACL|nr:MFS transporter [Marinithermofilum abyssi]GGE13966.1 MFS transporter [Marinithermofilum abyssi]